MHFPAWVFVVTRIALSAHSHGVSCDALPHCVEVTVKVGERFLVGLGTKPRLAGRCASHDIRPSGRGVSSGVTRLVQGDFPPVITKQDASCCAMGMDSHVIAALAVCRGCTACIFSSRPAEARMVTVPIPGNNKATGEQGTASCTEDYLRETLLLRTGWSCQDLPLGLRLLPDPGCSAPSSRRDPRRAPSPSGDRAASTGSPVLRTA